MSFVALGRHFFATEGLSSVTLDNHDNLTVKSWMVFLYIYNITGVALEKLVWHWQYLLQSPRDCPNSDPPSYGNL